MRQYQACGQTFTAGERCRISDEAAHHAGESCTVHELPRGFITPTGFVPVLFSGCGFVWWARADQLKKDDPGDNPCPTK